MNRLLLLALLVLLTGCPKKDVAQTPAGGELATSPPAATKAWSGNAADFTFANFAGGQKQLSSLAGKPVLLNFWADW